MGQVVLNQTVRSAVPIPSPPKVPPRSPPSNNQNNGSLLSRVLLPSIALTSADYLTSTPPAALLAWTTIPIVNPPLPLRSPTTPSPPLPSPLHRIPRATPQAPLTCQSSSPTPIAAMRVLRRSMVSHPSHLDHLFSAPHRSGRSTPQRSFNLVS